MPYKDKNIEKKYHKDYYLNNREYNKQDMINNFKNITNKGAEYLISKKFNETSSISTFSYCSFFNKNWSQLLKIFNKYDDFYNYILLEYKKYFNTTGEKSITKFYKNHKYITYDTIKNIKTSIFKQFINENNNANYSLIQLKDNFEMIKNKLKKIPNISEFIKYSPISIDSYTNYFSLKNYNWDNILKIFITDKEYKEFLKNQHENRIINCSNANKGNFHYSSKELDNEFKKVFDECFLSYGVYPTRAYFNKISKFNNNTYKKRYNKEWSEIREMYGYPKYNKENASEKICVDKIRKILNTKIEYQKTWKEWLRGYNGGVMHCDAYYPIYNLVVEFDGVTHRKPVDNMGGLRRYRTSVENDKLKNKFLKKHNIKLLRISSKSKWYDDNYLIEQLKTVGIN